jgi:hypothetical protein
MKRFVILFLAISLAINVFSQQKFESEVRIQRMEVPDIAVNLVDSMLPGTKIRWYKEAGYSKSSFEAKTKYNAKKVSIEFSEQGIFEDMEIGIKPKEIPVNSLKRISELLADTHGRFSIEKVQVQYSGDPHAVLNHFLHEKTGKDIVKKFELVISTKMDGSYVLFEYLFDENGTFLGKSVIVLKMTDNIEY